MRRPQCTFVVTLGCTLLAQLAVADDQPAIPEVVYIDPAPYLPEGMDQIVDEALESVPLSELAIHLREKYGLAVILLESALGDAGITIDEEIDFPAGLPLYQALAVALEDVAGTQLTWVMEDGVLKITTEEDAVDRYQVRVYDASSLQCPGWDTRAQMDSVQSFTSGIWMIELDLPPGQIDPVGGVLVMRQTQAIHLETAKLLDALSRDGRIIRVDHPPHHQRLFEALDQAIDIDIESQPLDQVLARISEQVGVPIRMRVTSLQDAGIEAIVPVSYHLGARSLRSVFKHMLADIGGTRLTYLVENGAICITTVDHSADHFELALYDVRDLLQVASMSSVLELVAGHTSGLWYDDGGVVGEYGILPNGYMVIRQTAAIHEEIAELLSLLRDKLVTPTAVDVDPAAFEVRHYYLKTAMADRLEQLLPELIAPGKWSINGDRDAAWISRVRIADNWGPSPCGRYGGQGGFGGGGQGFFQVPIGPAVHAAQSLPTYQGFGGGLGQSSSTTPSCHDVVLIIRQTNAVHEQIADFIEELNDPGRRLGRAESNYQIGPSSHVSEFDASIRSDVLSDPDWAAADRVDPWQTISEMPEQEVGYVAAPSSVPEVMRQLFDEPVVDVPLIAAAEYIQREYDIRVDLRLDDLEDAGLTQNDLVSIPGGLPLYMALDQGLREVAGTQLEWYFEDDILSISTPEVTVDMRLPMAYEVGDLLGPNDDGQWLIDFLQDQTSGEWQDMDGIGGAADVVGNVLLVRQAPFTQREVGSILDALRVDARVVRPADATNAVAFAALDQPVAIEFENQPLAIVIDEFSTQIGIPFQVRETALADIGITLDEEVTYQQGERPLRQVLNLMLEDVAGTYLTYEVENGLINITSEERAYDRFVTNIYQVSDLLDAMPSSNGRPDYQAMIDLVQAQTSGEWGDIDGFGGAETALPGGRLAFRTTQAVHEEVVALFAKLRAHLTPLAEIPFDPAAVETRYYSLLSDTADDLQRELPRLIAPETWRSDAQPDAVGVIRHSGDAGPNPLNHQGGFFQMDDDSPPDKPVKDLSEPEPPAYTWLIITQTAAVHQRIAALLEELASGIPASTVSWDRVDREGIPSEVIR